MMRMFLVFMLCGLFAAPLAAEEPVHFSDATLKAVVEDALWVTDPTPTDMLGLTSLSAGSAGISSITGLEYAANLEILSLPCNRITSISALSGLNNLKKIVLNNNEINSVSALSGLSNLEHLDMHDNHQISSISALSGKSKMYTLILRGNKVSDISVLSGLTSLKTVQLEHNEISNIAPLAGLTSLTRLDLRDNPLNDAAYDTYIPQILANNPGINLTYPASPSKFSISSSAGGSVIEPGEGQFNFTRTEFVFVEAVADPCFVFVGFSGSYTTTQNPTEIPVDQDHQIRAIFASVFDALYVDDDALADPGPGNAMISDPLENGTQEHPFDSIQEAMEVAATGASVVVRPGTYGESLTFAGKRIRVTGLDPNDPNQMDLPILSGPGNAPLVYFTQAEDANSILTGFVLSGGRGQPAGAILCRNSSPTIANCLIVGNRGAGTDGAAVYCQKGAPSFVNCTIADNDCGEQGAGLYITDSNAVVVNSIIWNNEPAAMLAKGTALPSLSYSDIQGGWPGLGNIDEDPLFVACGYWAHPNNPTIPLDPGDAGAVWMAGDYHLQSEIGRWDLITQSWVQDEATSPCIDAGDPVSPVGQELNTNGLIINMGTYGGSAEASLGR